MTKVMLCADSESVRNPELLGLEGENLLSQSWLETFSNAGDARKHLAGTRDVAEVWVSSSDDMEAINAAAAFKKDRGDLPVRLASVEVTGSLMSRANAAGIDAVLSRREFIRSYGEAKARYAGQGASAVVSGRATREDAARADVAALAGLPAETVGTQSSSGEVRLPEPNGCDPHFQKRTANTFLLPIVSGSGGVGRSAVAVLAALVAQQKGYATLLLDYDLRFGDAREMLDLPNALGVDEAIRHPEHLANVRPSEGKPALLAAPARLETGEGLVQKTGWLLDRIEGSYDVVVVNTGTSWDESHAVLLERATKVLFLVDQRLSSIRSCKHALELCERCGIATGGFSFALNRCSKAGLFTSIDVSCALQGASVVELADGQGEVEELLAAGSPEELLKVRNPFAESLKTVVLAMLPPLAEGSAVSVVEKPEKRGLFGRRRSRRKEK